MGYNTCFTFEFYCDENKEQEIRKWADEAFGGLPEDPCKWYEWREDMTKLSHQFPDVLIIIDGEGEESGDIWRAYVKNGKVIQKQAEIVHPALELSELKELNLC